jgi:hypothetical protein
VAEQDAHLTHPIPAALLASGFTFVKTETTDDAITAHGYVHKDGRAVLFSYNGAGPETERWRLAGPRMQPADGCTVEELRSALFLLKPGRKITGFVSAPPMDLPAANIMSAIKALKGDYDLAALHGEDAYGTRMRLLKLLRGTDKILAKTNTGKILEKEFYAAVEAKGAAGFALRCTALLREQGRQGRIASKAEQARIAKLLKMSVAERRVHDGKPIIEVKRKTAKQRRNEAVELKAELARKVREAADEEAATPLARPKPDAAVRLVVSDLRLIEDPNNGVVLFQLEKENSQGAICVYNNGSRVAAGVVSPEVLKTLRPIVGADLIQAANQLLNPITADTPVTPVAARHLTAVLHCKELIPMAAKFAPPADVVVRKSTKKAEKAVRTTKASKKSVAAGKEKAAKADSIRGIADEAKLKVSVPKELGDNPYREGSKSANSFELLKNSKTAGDFRLATEASKKDVYEATHFMRWASTEHGKQPAFLTIS